jgi:hypothetical protein
MLVVIEAGRCSKGCVLMEQEGGVRAKWNDQKGCESCIASVLCAGMLLSLFSTREGGKAGWKVHVLLLWDGVKT